MRPGREWLTALEQRYPALFEMHGDQRDMGLIALEAAADEMEAGPTKTAMVELVGLMRGRPLRLGHLGGGAVALEVRDEEWGAAHLEIIARAEELIRACGEALGEVIG